MNTANNAGYDAILIVGFGGPERPDDVLPFLENVTRGRNVPRERLLEVAEHYHHFGGKSPINDQVRALIDALRPELDRHGISLPIYWGNRNWHPMLEDAVRQMTRDGIKKALGLVLAAYSSYSSCRQYREDIQRAQDAQGPDAPEIHKLRVFYNHPDFIQANADNLIDALNRLPEGLRASARIAFTAHSIPSSMAATSRYEPQLREASRLVAETAGIADDRWSLVYQSRSGRPQDPWLEPDILDHLEHLRTQNAEAVVVHPIGFLSDHVEVLFDLDEEAALRAQSLGIPFVRARTVGADPHFIGMLRELIAERMTGDSTRRAIGREPASHDVCPLDCCPAPARPARPAHS
ncbi:MAG TPA: ferrochelatase [Isosphaeraceae bacterium]|nr:ferrochelatase [Isosphaeraceae bacterium]